MKRWLIPTALASLLAILALRIPDGASAGLLPLAGKPRIAQFRDDASAAVSYTFDDGLQAHADIAAPMLHDFGFRGTFYVVAGLARQHKSDPVFPSLRARHFRFGEAAISWDEIRHLRDLGMEIGNHSMTHTFLNKIKSDAELEDQVNHAAALITENLGQPPVTFAFPYNEYTPHCKEVVLRHHLAVRENWTDFGGANFNTQTANALVDNAVRNHNWFVPMIHGIDGGFLPLSSRVFREHLAYVKTLEDKVWVDTYAEVAAYQLERTAARLNVEESVPGELTFFIEHERTTNPSVPLTVILPLPLNENSDDVRAATAAGDAIAINRQPDRILIDLPPNTDPITVTWH